MSRRQQRHQQKRAREDVILAALRSAAQRANPADIHGALVALVSPFATEDSNGELRLSREAMLRLARETLSAGATAAVEADGNENDDAQDDGSDGDAVDEALAVPRAVDEADVDRLIVQCRTSVASKSSSAGGGAAAVHAAAAAGGGDVAAASIRVGDLCWLVSMQGGAADVRAKRMTDGQQDNSSITAESSALLRYYAEHPLFSGLADEERVRWVESMKTPLPMSLRVHSSQPVLQNMAKRMLDELAAAAASPLTHRGPIFAPDSKLSHRRAAVDVYSCPHVAYHQASQVELAARTLHSGAAVSFQEIVSMLPVIALDVQPHHRVLDMCAAPGSKTLQALDDAMPDGAEACSGSSVVLVNEKDRTKATQTLPARLKRYHAPNAIITRCDASQLPTFIDPAAAAAGVQSGEGDGAGRVLFDRIICDVPCSGDGTVRKERSVFFSWSPEYAASLTPVQQSILRRAFDLLAPGGVLVYSTCSLNPSEDESVILSLLRMFPRDAALLDVNELLSQRGVNLRSRGGVLLPVEELREHAPQSGEGGAERAAPREFAGGRLEPSILAELQAKVLRVLPHRDDTGGFFLAALTKRAPPQPAPLAPRCLEKVHNWAGIKRWEAVLTSPARHVWDNAAAFYGFAPTAAAGRFTPLFHVTPSGDRRRIVLATDAAAHLALSTRLFKGPGLELVAMGLRLFELFDGSYLAEAQCRWRPTHEGTAWLASVATKRKAELDCTKGATHAGLAQALLVTGSVSADDFGAFYAPVGAGSASSASAEHLGGFLVGLRHDKLICRESPWWLPAVFNGRRLELSVDVSVRAMAAWALFGVAI